MFRQIANPRRTTLAHLKDASELATVETVETSDTTETTGARELPQRTANPRRTVLNEPPRTPVAP